jgi:hypothetical protein
MFQLTILGLGILILTCQLLDKDENLEEKNDNSGPSSTITGVAKVVLMILGK